jgi:hypothetical protein
MFRMNTQKVSQNQFFLEFSFGYSQYSITHGNPCNVHFRDTSDIKRMYVITSGLVVRSVAEPNRINRISTEPNLFGNFSASEK